MPKYIAIPTADGTSLTNAKMIDGATAFSGLTNGTTYSVYRLSDTAASATPLATATLPAQFGASDWSVATGASANQVVLNVSALPSNGGSEITALQYTIDGGSTWTALSGTGTGLRTLTMPAAGTSYAFAIRAVNAVGAGAASATKSATSGASSTAATISFSASPKAGTPIVATVTPAAGWTIQSAYGWFDADGVTITNPSAGIYQYTAPTAGTFKLDVTMSDGTTTQVVSASTPVAYAAAASATLEVSPSTISVGDTVTVTASIINGVGAAFSLTSVTIGGVEQTVSVAYPSFSFTATAVGAGAVGATIVTDNGTVSPTATFTVQEAGVAPSITFTSENVVTVNNPPSWLVTNNASQPFFLDFPQYLRRRVNWNGSILKMEGHPVIAAGNAVLRQNGNSVSITYSGGHVGGVLTPIEGVLDKPFALWMGDSILDTGEAVITSGGLLTGLGFTGAQTSTATGGDKIADQMADLITYKAANGNNGNRLLIGQVGYNNTNNDVSTFATEYNTYVAEMAAGGDVYLPVPMTKGYPPAKSAVDPLNPSTDGLAVGGAATNRGTDIYNRTCIWPKIPTEWMSNGKPLVDPYDYSIQRYGFGQPATGDGTHMTATDMPEYMAGRIYARVKGMRLRSRAGKSLTFTFASNAANRLLGPTNVMKCHGALNLTSHSLVMANADGTIDPFIHVEMSGAYVGNFTPTAAQLAVFSNDRFKNTLAAGTNVYYNTADTTEDAVQMYVKIRMLYPGDKVTLGVACNASAAAYGGKYTFNGVTQVLSGPSTTKKDHFFAQATVPESGEIVLNITNPAGVSRPGFSAISLDFAA